MWDFRIHFEYTLHVMKGNWKGIALGQISVVLLWCCLDGNIIVADRDCCRYNSLGQHKTTNLLKKILHLVEKKKNSNCSCKYSIREEKKEKSLQKKEMFDKMWNALFHSKRPKILQYDIIFLESSSNSGIFSMIDYTTLLSCCVNFS